MMLCVCVEDAYVHCLYYFHTEQILRAAEVPTGSASSQVVSFSQYPIVGKMECLWLEWIQGCIKYGVPVSYT